MTWLRRLGYFCIGLVLAAFAAFIYLFNEFITNATK